MRLGRPVKWIEDRMEHLVATNHSRQQRRRLRGAFDRRGRILALEDEVLHDNGAYLRTHGVLVPELTLSMLPGPYRVPAYAGAVDVALTNKTPSGTYRAPGRYEATFARERLLDVAAAELGLDPVELRRRNLLTPADLPVDRALPVLGHEVHIDVGDPLALLEQTLEAAGHDAWRAEAEAARERGELVGNGVACFLEKSGGGAYEESIVSVGTDGRVAAVTGGASLGQGIETVVAQAVAEQLQVPVEDVDVICGDTDRLRHGGGSWASRSTIYSGTSTSRAAEDVAVTARRVAAELLEADAADVVLAGGRAMVAGSPGRAVTLAEVAAACDPSRRPTATVEALAPRGLTATATATDLPMTYPYGVHLAQVRIDGDTGGLTVTRYFVGYEIGRAVNPMLVRGQLEGGAAQGIGGAILEEFRYDPEGQPLSTTFMDYVLPSAREVPDLGVLVREDAPSPGNPLGVKGAGEGGDALGVPGAIRRLPITPGDLRAERV
jgi:carbon-monoxide dehydrogenase large subunit/6-hydroxypseudooxynicotine dehydrogenase subunit gamma